MECEKNENKQKESVLAHFLKISKIVVLKIAHDFT